MTDLLFAGGNNVAGMFLVRVAPVSGILTLPPALPGAAVNGGTFRGGFRWYDIYGTEGTKDYDEEQQITDNGPVWSVRLSLFLPGDTYENRLSLASMAIDRFVIECQDNNGLWRRLGNPIQNLSMSYKFGIDPQMGGKRGATMKFSGDQTTPPQILSLL